MLTVVKLGSSTVVADDGSVREDVLARVAAACATPEPTVLVSSGAIAVGIRTLGLGVRPTAVADLQAASAVGQGGLFARWDAALAAAGRQSAQLLLTSFDLAGRLGYLNARKTLERLLAWSVVPVINENDTTTTDEISFGDNDVLAAQVAILLGADRLVLLTDLDGLYSADPRSDPAAALVGEVHDFGAALDGVQIAATTSRLGSGGMRSKIVAAEMASAAGIPTTIANGVRRGALERVMAGEAEGTRFGAREARASSFKLWLRYAKPTLGRVEVDAGAARALREAGTSLLPVGIVGVEGSFDAGDAVEVVTGGRLLGKGIVNYTAGELRQVAGLQSAQVRAVLPRAVDEAVHRDYFVLA